MIFMPEGLGIMRHFERPSLSHRCLVRYLLCQVAETLPADVLAKMHAPPKPDVPVLDAHDLAKADGVIFGMSGRFGGVPAQMKAFWDATGQHWSKGALVNKPVSAFVSTGNQQGGQESIFLTSMPFFVGQVRDLPVTIVSFGSAFSRASTVGRIAT